MPDKKNREALAAAFGGAFFKVCGGALDPQELLELAREVVRTHGVLVPSALTDEEATDFPFDGAFMATGKDGELAGPAADRRAALERIAKGE
jgi:hypothetical protein